MTKPPFTALLLVALLHAATPAVAADDAGSTAPASPAENSDVEAGLLNELKALDEKLVKIEDLRGTFSQEKHTALLKKPLTSSGTVIVKGPSMRWDALKPTPSTTLTSPGEVRIYFPRQKLVEVYRVDERLASVIASPLPRLIVLLKNFKIERQPTKEGANEKHLAIRLTPRTEELGKHLTRVDVSIDRETALAVSMEMVDADEDRVVIAFADLKTNTGVKDEELELKTPSGTKVVRPLEALER